MKQQVKTEQAAPAIGAYSQGVSFGNLVITSGQLALLPSGEWAGGDARAQAKQAMDNLGAVLRAAGTDYDRVVKTTIFVANMDDFADINEVYSGYFQPPFPARSLVQVARLPKDALVEIEAIAELH
ncbi:endoribonuclease L-PSP [Deinococcus proteolyticus MRP]|uniref:Endoribonuclease L-PSP n=1 Tax=Deinococcus proteolyticus (strain ATCC 35074 / DSM 20540 / JCM 6276 / NBRC 101906 / NCIMB 13154 / VKM Ac-1939 / CCM 2703 / MRP) TaxID=693977 RepID=F0RK61_DEIPM|nr:MULTISPECIES: RidA family protein [Deinococcus]ADY25620.1 endoribonuclease L-PSP [Deinococcus proteolyticus MRP]MCY1701739.1 RidA family protein [Deinococcus sp. SL84]MDO4263436.1 RidA family protein [Deinococcus sp.]